jgi:hypothetical protein
MKPIVIKIGGSTVDSHDASLINNILSPAWERIKVRGNFKQILASPSPLPLPSRERRKSNAG